METSNKLIQQIVCDVRLTKIKNQVCWHQVPKSCQKVRIGGAMFASGLANKLIQLEKIQCQEKIFFFTQTSNIALIVWFSRNIDKSKLKNMPLTIILNGPPERQNGKGQTTNICIVQVVPITE